MRLALCQIDAVSRRFLRQHRQDSRRGRAGVGFVARTGRLPGNVPLRLPADGPARPAHLRRAGRGGVQAAPEGTAEGHRRGRRTYRQERVGPRQAADQLAVGDTRRSRRLRAGQDAAADLRRIRRGAVLRAGPASAGSGNTAASG